MDLIIRVSIPCNPGVFCCKWAISIVIKNKFVRWWNVNFCIKPKMVIPFAVDTSGITVLQSNMVVHESTLKGKKDLVFDFPVFIVQLFAKTRFFELSSTYFISEMFWVYEFLIVVFSKSVEYRWVTPTFPDNLLILANIFPKILKN